MKILIYGAGVIGSLYAVLFSKAGYSVSVLARNQRLTFLQKNGLLYRQEGQIKHCNVNVISALHKEDIYDYIFLTVRAEQAEMALLQLAENRSPTIVTMINTITDYSQWEKLCGTGRILPAFPGAGGSIVDGILDAHLTSYFVQPTTFGEINGKKTNRLKTLASIFKQSHIPYQIVANMHNWQLCHLGLVVPLADAYYRSKQPEHVYLEKNNMQQIAKELKQNMRYFQKRNQISPRKFYLMLLCPKWLMKWILKKVYQSDFGYTFMYQHAMKAPHEMERLHAELYTYMGQNKSAIDS